MILTDREIRLALERQHIVITPKPELDCYTSTSLDLRLADSLTIFKSGLTGGAIETSIDPTKNYSAEREIKKISDETDMRCCNQLTYSCASVRVFVRSESDISPRDRVR